MQYYRLWIYSCNVLLGLTSAIFIIFAAFVVADVRLSLLEGVELYHPTFLYAYGALILQCGVVQTIGCLGAKRLSHKLLSLYWTLLLLLTLGDIGVGLYWVFHLEKVKINLRPYLAKEFIEKYSTDESFTIKWNRIQSQDRCCGVDGPFDFEKFSNSHHHYSKQAAFSAANSHLIVDVETGLLSLPQSCCTLIYVPTTISSSSSSGTGVDPAHSVSNYPPEEEHPPFSDQSPDASALPHDDYTSDFAGGGRRSRTVINLPHKNDEPRTEVFYDPVGVDEVETDFYVDYAISPQEPAPVAPVDHIQSVKHKVKLPDNNYSASELERREIKSHGATTHAHKVRHELHRKSQSSSLIGVKLLKNSTLGIIGESRDATTAKNVGESSSSSAGIIINTAENSGASASTVIIRKDETVVRHNAEILHQNESHNKTNKSFPSITVRLQRKERETRALSVTQVPAVSAPIIHRRIDCHGQPEGLNHHSSYKKDLLDQRKTTKDKQGAKTSPNKRVGASWPYPVTTTRTTSSTTAAETSTSSSSTMAIQSKFTFAVSTEKVEANEIEKLTKRQEGESLMATQPSPGIMTGSAVNAALHSSKLTSFSSSGTTRSTSSSEKMRRRQKRNAEMNVDNSDSTLQSDPFGISQSSAFMSTEEKESEKGSDSLAESYFFPVSSSSAVSSSASFLEASSPHRAILSPSAASHDQWNENNESGSSNNNGNSSVSGIQKRLYVYGQGCGVKLIEWVDHVSGIMFILGFCIIGFVKTCFLVILRTEIREMIEKIHMIEPEEILSPSRTHSAKEPKFHHVSHPLLQNPHRASTVSAHGVLLPTIKSPDGPSTSGIASGVGGYNRPNRHYLRRASNIVGGDRSRSHSNETVNMTLLMTTPHGESNREKGRSNPNLTSGGGSSGTIANTEERDPVSGLSIPVPSSSSAAAGTTTAPRYLRRSSTCSSSANPVGGYPYQYGFDGEPRAGPSSRFYQYFEPVYQTSHLYQQHHHHHYTRNRPHARNMSCGAILPLTSYRTNSAAAAATALASYRGVRTFNTAASNTVSAGASFSSTSKDENEMIISVSLEHIASSDQDEETVEEEKEQEKKDWAAACTDKSDQAKSDSAKCEEEVGTKLQTFTVSESVNETSGVGNGERELQRRNGNNNVDLANSLPMSYIGTAV